MLASNSPSPEKIEGEARIIRNVQNEIITKPQNPAVERHPIVRSVSAEVKTSSRGTAMMLPKRFLSVPHFRVLERSENEEKMSFTITFNRKHNKLGITIQEMNSLIQIIVVHRSADGQMLLAEAAGVCVGDILAGINGERFGPWAELKDVMDLLTLSGHFVTIQFDRYKRSSVWHNAIYQTPSTGGDSAASNKLTSLTEFPSRMKIFLENSVITVEQTPILESTIRYLKYRDVEWSASSLAEKINIWHLDAPTEESPTSPTSSSREAVTGSVRLSKTSQSKSTNRRHSLDSAVLAEIVRQEMADDQRYMQKYSDVETHNLRPALSVRLLRAEQGKGDYIVYVIWVLDVRSGVEWIIRRRYREFEVFREVSGLAAPTRTGSELNLCYLPYRRLLGFERSFKMLNFPRNIWRRLPTRVYSFRSGSMSFNGSYVELRVLSHSTLIIPVRSNFNWYCNGFSMWKKIWT